MSVIADYDNGDVLDSKVLSINPSTILENFGQGVLNIAAISLESGYLTAPAVPHVIQNAFKNLAAIGLESGYKFKEIDGAGKAPAPAAAAKVETKAAPAKPVGKNMNAMVLFHLKLSQYSHYFDSNHFFEIQLKRSLLSLRKIWTWVTSSVDFPSRTFIFNVSICVESLFLIPI